MLIARPIYYFIQIPSFASQSCLNQVFLSLSPVTNVLKFDRYDSYIASHSKILIDNADLRISRSSRTLSALTKSKLSGIFELFSKSFRRTIETDPTTKHKTRQSSEPLRTKKRFAYIEARASRGVTLPSSARHLSDSFRHIDEFRAWEVKIRTESVKEIKTA